MIDLMSDDVFTSHEIDARVVSIIRQKYTLEDEQKIARIAVGALQKTYTPSASEVALIAAYQVDVEAARAIGAQAAKDNALLADTIAYEGAEARLAEPIKKATDKDADGNLLYPDVEEMDANGKPTGKMLPNPALAEDKAERAAAAKIKKGTSAAAKALAADRIPAQVTP